MMWTWTRTILGNYMAMYLPDKYVDDINIIKASGDM